MTEKELCLCKLEEVCLKCEEYKIEFNHYAQEVHNAWLNEQAEQDAIEKAWNAYNDDIELPY